jgi:hypothetical protein
MEVKLVNQIQKAILMGSLGAIMAATAHSENANCGASIQSLMTPEQYRNAGLDKLTADERRALDSWLQTQTCGVVLSPTAEPPPAAAATPAKASPPVAAAVPAETATVPAATLAAQPSPESAAPVASKTIPAAEDENFGFPDPIPETSDESNQLHARVVGKFRGWSGKTVFTLDNGQVWRQRVSGRYTYTGDDTRVVISQNRFGFYDMRLVVADRSVGVSRVK